MANRYFYLDIKIIDSWADYFSDKMYIIFEIAGCLKFWERPLEIKGKDEK